MLVISSDDDLADHSPLEFLSMGNIDSNSILNLLGDYRYLRLGYYVSLHAELLNLPVMPTIKDILDVYRAPLLSLRAQNVGIPTVPYKLVTDPPNEAVLPCVLIATNPFTINSLRVAKSRVSLTRAIVELGYDGRYPVCIQPLLGRLQQFEMAFGCTMRAEYSMIAKQFFEEFKIPLGKLVIQQAEETSYLCQFLPISLDEINYPWFKDVLVGWRKDRK